jgi:hypothetical protein
MTRTGLVVAVGCVVLSFASWAPAADELPKNGVNPASALRSPSELGHITDPKLRAIALFEEVGKVMLHPRCLNCHPASDQPTQTEQMQPHRPPVQRGATGFGVPGMPCSTCHHDANFDAARVPGHPQWHLAPRSMAWAGHSLGEICAQIKDRARNGGRDLAAVVRHMSDDSLVGWAWAPGGGRAPAPGSQKELGALLKAWMEAGATCPSE